MTEKPNVLSRQDYAVLTNPAHAVKGILGSFFAEANYALTLKPEQNARNYQFAEFSMLCQNLTVALQQLLQVFQQKSDTHS